MKYQFKNGLERFNEFKTHYKDGWDFGKGKALSPFSTRSLIMFFDRVGSFNNEPSLFLTRNGNLQIVWEDKHNNTVELEFFRDKIDYYIESENLEGKVSLDDIDDLVSLLKIQCL